MDEKEIKKKKITPLASTIGAGIGVIHGTKNNTVVSSTTIGAGVGLLAGLMASSLFTKEEKQETENESAEQQTS